MNVRPDGQVLYVTRLGGPHSVVDLEQNVVIKEIDSGSMPHRLSFTNDGSRLFVVNAGSDTLSVNRLAQTRNNQNYPCWR